MEHLLKTTSKNAFVLNSTSGLSFLLFNKEGTLESINKLVKKEKWLSTESAEYELYLLEIRDNKYYTGVFNGQVNLSTIILINEITNWSGEIGRASCRERV